MKRLILHNLHFSQTLTAFAKRKTAEGKSHSHIQSVTYHAKEFLHFLEERNITQLTRVIQTDIDAYFTYLQYRPNTRREGGLSNAYLQKHREAVLRLMEYLKNADTGHSGFHIPKFKTDPIPKDILTEAEVAQLFQQCLPTIDGIRSKAILSLLYGCGLRKGELHKLNVADFDIVKDTIRIQKTKTAHQRDVPVSQQVKTHLEAYLYHIREQLLSEPSQEPAFILNNRGERLSLAGIQYKIETIAKQSGIPKPITAHRLRHAIATHLLDHFNIEEIAMFLGHQSIDSSQIYTHLKHPHYG